MTTPRILVCDDTPAKRYVLTSWLRRAGFAVLECATAGEAVALLQTETIDLAVLDVHLPDGSGLDITRTIRSDAALASTPVIHVSAVARELVDKVTALDEGADAYLVDPIEPDEMISTVRALLRSSSARRDAELLATRLARLNRAAVRLNVAASILRLVEATARAANEVLDAPAVALHLDEQGEAWWATATGSERTVTSGVVPQEKTAPLLAQLGADVEVVDPESGWSEHLPAAHGDWLVCPIRIDTALVGVVTVPVGSPDDRDGQAVLLQRLAQAAAVAIENLRTLAFEHRTALTLQRSLLPSVLPEPVGVGLAARYRASQQRVEIGGDFFDAFEVDDECMLVIGDVQGHSLEAAVVMAELRYSLRAYAFEGHDPTVIADLLDDLLDRSGSELIATVCILVLDRSRRQLRVVTAGHPAPILVRAGVPRLIEERGPLLGAGIRGREAAVRDVSPGDRLVLYTDGLVERRGEDLIANTERLVDQVGAFRGSPHGLADALLATWGDSPDDVALLVVDITS
ncbi:SpoIIE family protein phosphatase [Nocardioides pyridinolyticus]